MVIFYSFIRSVWFFFSCSYGQTGTGKTYTMEGERSQDDCSWEEVSDKVGHNLRRVADY